MKHNIDHSTVDLLGRVSELGNHHQKHVFNIERNLDALTSLLDEKRLIDQIRLLRLSNNPIRAMQKIAYYIKDSETQLDMLGCYYSLQFLLLNLKAIDVLKLDLSTITSKDKYHIFESFLIRTGDDFRRLSSAYISTLLDIFLPIPGRPPFIMCIVGTRVDQDDIDVGIIDKGKRGRKKITAAFAALSKQMLKNACPLHFHLSEHVGGGGYSASIQEYHDLLDDKIRDFVLLTEMLNAVPIFGDNSIFQQFKQEILGRYFFRKGRENKYHEGYLRGLLGEIQDLYMRAPRDNVLHPKKDALRMIKAIIFALKTSMGIDKTTSIEVLNVLMEKRTKYQEDYYRLYRSLTFIETFRFLFQLYVVQQEQVFLEETNMLSHLQIVAQNMGYENINYAKASTQLLIYYQDNVEQTQFAAGRILQNISKHLGKITVFSPLQHMKPLNFEGEKYLGNIAKDFIRATNFFSGARFWDDFLTALNSSNQRLLNKLLQDFDSMATDERRSIIMAYVKWGKRSPYTLVFLLTIIKERKPEYSESDLTRDFIDYFLKSLQRKIDDMGQFSKVLDYYPRRMYNFIALFSEKQLSQLIEILDTPIMDPEVEKTRVKLLAICTLHFQSSYYFQRFIHRVFNTYHSYLIAFDNPKKLREFSDGLLGNIDNFNSIDEKIDKLGTYYDFEFMRLGIDSINGMFYGIINREFTSFSDNYIQILFQLCRQKTAKNYTTPPETKDLLAVFAAGGHARSQAFDDDYDLIILLNSTDPKKIKFANEIIIKMNKYIIKRSIMPHFRFADRFKNYVTTFREIEAFFKKPDKEAFIDKSQLLGARMIVGSAHFEDSFTEEIITPFIFEKNREFIQSLIEEISSRNKYHHDRNILNIKESPGGLRDLENFLFILKAYYRMRAPISSRLFSDVAKKMKQKESLFDQLFLDYFFLKQIRDLYHLMVSDDDEIQKQYLENIIVPLNNGGDFMFRSAADIIKRVNNSMLNNIKNIENIINHLGYSFHYRK